MCVQVQPRPWAPSTVTGQAYGALAPAARNASGPPLRSPVCPPSAPAWTLAAQHLVLLCSQHKLPVGQRTPAAASLCNGTAALTTDTRVCHAVRSWESDSQQDPIQPVHVYWLQGLHGWLAQSSPTVCQITIACTAAGSPGQMQTPAAARLTVQSPKPGSGWKSVTYLHPVHGEKSVHSRQATPMPKLAGLRQAAISQSESEVSAGDAPEVTQQGPVLQQSLLQRSEPEQVSIATGTVSMSTT